MKAYERSKIKLTEFGHNSILGSSDSENLLEASIYRVSSKLAVRDKFEFLLYLLCLQPSSSSDLLRSIKCAINALAWNVISDWYAEWLIHFYRVQLARFWTFTSVAQRKCVESSFVLWHSGWACLLMKILSLMLRFRTVEVHASFAFFLWFLLRLVIGICKTINSEQS